MFAFAFEERLFAFRQPKPAFAPLFALADKRAPAATTLLCFYFFQSNAIFVAPFTEFCSPSKTAQAEPKVRMRIRGTTMRTQTTETRIRTIIRISRQKGTSLFGIHILNLFLSP